MQYFWINLFPFVNFLFNEHIRIAYNETRDWYKNTFQLISTFMFVEPDFKRNETDIRRMNELGKKCCKL